MQYSTIEDVRRVMAAGRVWAGDAVPAPLRVEPARPVAGGKPNPGTPKDKRLSENKGGKKGGKKPFPGAAPPFKKGS
jgi:hypothetical protein